LNRDNPLGTGGDLAIQFASLLGEMWGTANTRTTGYGTMYGNSTNSVVYPRNFKYTLGRHAEQFVGYDQHDSQELATYLLDALHEDTNRVTKKPYVEKPEQEKDESDEEAAKKAWELHLKREDSHILEYFMGQVKSRVKCCKESCGRVSTTFDPFMYLSVPIPGSSEKTLNLIFVPLDPKMRPQNIPVKVSKSASMRDVSNKLVQQLRKFRIVAEGETIPPEDICLVDVFQKVIYSWYEDGDDVDRISDTDKTFAYQLRSLADIRKLEAERATSVATEAYRQIPGLRERNTPKKYKLDIVSITRLNKGDNWLDELQKYLRYSPGVVTAFNPNRGSTTDRIRWYNKVCQFIDVCYRDAESELAGQKRARDDTADSLFVSPDEAPLPSIRERSDSSPEFKNVERRYDLAVLEFVAKKMHANIVDMENRKKEFYPDGVVIQIRIRKHIASSFAVGGKEQNLAEPFVLRIASNTTVYGLREILAKALARALKTGHQSRQSSASGESTSERPTSTVLNGNGDDISCGDFGDPALLVVRQVPLAYERCSRNNFGSSSVHATKLGALERGGESRVGSRPVTLAGPNDEDERAIVSQIVGDRGMVLMEWPEELVERFLDLKECETVEQPTPGDDDTVAGRTRKSNALNVLDCIDRYCQMEQLEETEMWYCNQCKEHVRAWKHEHLYRSPPILIIHLKRFQYSATTHRRDKINTFVDFPLEGLDLTQHVMHWTEDEKPIYDCYAVSNHYGGLGGGHYTAYALNDDGKWCYYDDSRVNTDVDAKDVVTQSAYVLYYRRRDVPVGEPFVVSTLTPGGEETPAIIQDPLDKIVDDSSDSSNAAMVDEEERMDVDDTDLASRTTSPMGSIDGAGDHQFDDDNGGYDPPGGLGIARNKFDDDMPLQ